MAELHYVHIAPRPDHSIQLTTDRYIAEQIKSGIEATGITDANAPWLKPVGENREESVAESAAWLQQWLAEHTDASRAFIFELHFHQKGNGTDILLDAINQLRAEGLSNIAALVRFHEVERAEQSDLTAEREFLHRVLDRTEHAIFSCSADQALAEQLRESPTALNYRIMPRYYPFPAEERERPSEVERDANLILFHGVYEAEKGIGHLADVVRLLHTHNHDSAPAAPLRLRVTGSVTTQYAQQFEELLALCREYPDCVSFWLGGAGIPERLFEPDAVLPAGCSVQRKALSGAESIALMQSAGTFLILQENVYTPRSSTGPLAFAHETPVIVYGSGTRFPEMTYVSDAGDTGELAWFAQNLADIPRLAREIQQLSALRQERLAEALNYQRSVEPSHNFPTEDSFALEALKVQNPCPDRATIGVGEGEAGRIAQARVNNPQTARSGL